MLTIIPTFLKANTLFSIYRERVLALLLYIQSTFILIHNYVQQDINIFLKYILIFYNLCTTIPQVISFYYRYISTLIVNLYNVLTEPAKCTIIKSDPIIVSGAINYASKGFPVKTPLFYEEVKFYCTNSGIFYHLHSCSCKHSNNEVE